MIIKFHFIADYGEEKKNTAYDRKGAFRKWILCTKRKDRQKKKHLIRQTNASSSSSSSSTYAAHATQPTSNLLCQKKKKYNQLIQTKHSITCLTS